MTCLKCSAHDVNLQDKHRIVNYDKGVGSSFQVCGPFGMNSRFPSRQT